MGIHRYPKNPKKWRADYSFIQNGKRVRKYKVFDSRKDAEKWLGAHKHEFKPSLSSDNRTIDETFEWFQTRPKWTNLAEATRNSYTQQLKTFIKWCDEHHCLRWRSFAPENEHRFERAEAYYQFLQARGPSARMQVSIAIMLTNIELNRIDAAIHRSPWTGVELLREAATEVRRFTERELELIFQFSTPAERRLWDFFLNTGLRRGEFNNLSDPQIVDGVIKIVEHDGWKPKHGKKRIVPLNSIATKALKEMREDCYDPYWIAVRYERGKVVRFNKDWIHILYKHLKERIGEPSLKDTRPHTFRATFGSRLIERGVPVAIVAELMGHSSVSTTQRYYQSLLVESKVSAVRLLEAALETVDRKNG